MPRVNSDNTGFGDARFPTSDQKAALDAADSPSGSNGFVTTNDARLASTQVGWRLRRQIEAGLGGTIVVASDSTGNNSGSPREWPYLMADWFAAQYPSLKVDIALWTDGGSTWPAATTVQAGSGSGGTLTIYNCAVPGSSARYFQSPYFDTMIAARQPDVCFVNLGHNDGASVPAEPFWRDELTALRQLLTRACPNTEVVILTQNPRTDSGAANIAGRRLVEMRLAAVMGDGLVDTFGAMLAAGGGTVVAEPSPGALLVSDGVHPNQDGQNAIWAEIERCMEIPALGVNQRSQQPSSLVLPTTNLLANGSFADFASPPTLTSWTANNATLSKDTTNYETKGYGVRMQAASAAQSSMTQALGAANLRLAKGQWITLAARMYRPSGSAGTVGRVGITESGGSHAGGQNSNPNSFGAGGFAWVVASRRIAIDATAITLSLWCDSSTSGAGDVTFDRVILATGMLPRDVIA